MLRDIESRQPRDPPQPVSVKPVYQDLRPAARTVERKASSRAVFAVLGLTLVASVAYYVWHRERVATPAAHTAPVAPTQIAKPAPTPGPHPAPSPAEAGPASPPAVAATAVIPVPSAPATDSLAAASSHPAPTPVEPAPTVAETPQTTAPVAASKPVVKVARSKPAEAAGADAPSIDKRLRPLSAQEKAESDYRQAARRLDEGRAYDANRLLAQALAADPQHTRARELLIALALKNGRTHEARQLLDDGMRLVPGHVPFVYLSARLQVEQGADGEALALLERTAPLAERDADYQSLLAALYQRQGRHGDAVAAYRRTVELRPNDARAWVGLGISLEVEKELDAARVSYQRARDLGDLPPALARHASQRLAQLAQR